MSPPWIDALLDALSPGHVALEALALGWMRVAPSIAIVPAFGLRALPPAARAVVGLAFAACILPAIPPAAGGGSVPWALQALEQAALGLPVAIAAAVPLWAATMAGGVVDALRGSQETVSFPTVEGRPTSLGVPLSVLASAFFLAGGGPARVAEALAAAPRGDAVVRAAHDLTAGIALAVALAGPLLAASVVVEIAAALVARAASPAQVHALIAPLRALALLAVAAVVMGRIAGLLARAVAAAP